MKPTQINTSYEEECLLEALEEIDSERVKNTILAYIMDLQKQKKQQIKWLKKEINKKPNIEITHMFCNATIDKAFE